MSLLRSSVIWRIFSVCQNYLSLWGQRGIISLLGSSLICRIFSVCWKSLTFCNSVQGRASIASTAWLERASLQPHRVFKHFLFEKKIKPNFYLCHTKKFKNSATQFSNLVSTSPSQCGRCQRKAMWRQSILSTLSLLWWALNTLIAYCIALKLELYDFTHSFIHYFQIRKRDSLIQYWKS